MELGINASTNVMGKDLFYNGVKMYKHQEHENPYSFQLFPFFYSWFYGIIILKILQQIIVHSLHIFFIVIFITVFNIVNQYSQTPCIYKQEKQLINFRNI